MAAIRPVAIRGLCAALLSLVVAIGGISPATYAASASVDRAAEVAMLAELNAARQEAGLPPLLEDASLLDVARDHSLDMAGRDYFDHDSPEGVSPFDRMRSGGAGASWMGENLAMAPSVRQAQDLLMASPPHRENILKPEYDRVGIGVVVAPNGERWFTEDFAGGAPLS